MLDSLVASLRYVYYVTDVGRCLAMHAFIGKLPALDRRPVA